MFTRCPSCQTLFRVRAEILRIAHGQVRCGRCGMQFNALDGLAEDPETLAAERNGALAEAGKEPESQAVASPDEPDRIDSAATLEATSGDADATADAGADEVIDSSAELDQDESAAAVRSEAAEVPESEIEVDQGPVSAETPPEDVVGDGLTTGLTASAIQEALLSDEPTSGPWGLRLAGIGAVLLLLAALAVQWVYMQRVPLYAQPEWRPALQRFCALLACELPLPRKPEQVEILERVVREHPRVAKALLVDLTFISRAEEPIAFPIVNLRLADVSGNRVMGRQFSPSEYLPASIDSRIGLSPDKPVHITLELVAPVTDVVSFQFDFL
jgi:predicted Zn finger-like uncharacterized protein